MEIKKIPLSQLEADPAGTLAECYESGDPWMIEMPDFRRLSLHPREPAEPVDLIDDLIANNAEFRDLVEKLKASGFKPFSFMDE